MSGGVDSAVAAGLLARQGYEVVGNTMRLWTEEDPLAPRNHRRCCPAEDTDGARAAAHVLGTENPAAIIAGKPVTLPEIRPAHRGFLRRLVRR